ncbi:hypothetical protein EJ04DRAFT_360290 [Polyplosphaeria fusca]|uniref:NACHT domain-containing protein n=1 Tax=Polyplosphaeria fusca TaxID=682080 RepID=A0A9P4UZ21_9PLEO|nr:hypothetical protein EJ04DRAFT_360290 [Polyplosphaeria fusca]
MATRTATDDSNATTVRVLDSPFARALEEYIQSRPKKSKTPGFLHDLQKRKDAGEALDQNAVKLEIMQLEKDATDRRSAQIVRKTLNPVIRCISDYASIIEVLVQADPMPSALIWGTLKAVVQASSRFLELYDKIKDQLTTLNDHINVLIMYDDLFGHSSTMQELLQASYVHIIRFWHRVEKECRRHVANRLAQAVFSFSTSKIDGIVSDIEKVSDKITLLVPAVQERIQKGEREDAAEERRLAGIAREEQTALFQMTANELKLRNEERKRMRKQEVGKWLLSGASHINESNHRHQEHNLSLRSSGTCAWLIKNEKFLDWLDASNDLTTLWMKAAPGTGKSVLTSFAIEQARKRVSATSAVCFQYYTFDEEFTCLQVLRSLTEQLANRLWEQTENMPEEIHDITMKSTTSSNGDDVRAMLRMLIGRMSETYIFLDGLDEECDNGQRWGHLRQLVDFLLDIIKKDDLKVKLWCSSQPRACIENRLQNFTTIEITQELNTRDIKSYLDAKIPELGNLELDAGYRNVMLEDLSVKADGCFLWASLMLHSIANATSLRAIHEHIRVGLPSDYENYYLDKMRNIDPSNKGVVSVLLSCILHSKRPLRLDELCEATATVATESGKDVDRSAKLFRSRVVALCQPLVNVQEIQMEHGTISTCTLAHATVRDFLIKHANVLCNDESSKNAISASTMADVCLTYLMQPRYNVLLRREGIDFKDKRDESIMEHHLLVYVAKYWDKHLDSVDYSPELLDRVMRFLKSRQYFTSLQVQSLLVGGQFAFWYSANQLWLGPHIKRVFPIWLQTHCEEDVEHAYRLFVSDWGSYLDAFASVNGSNAGEIDRCFFEALGRESFLSKGTSRYKSFVLKPSDKDADQELPARFFDAMNTKGTELLVLSLKELYKDISELEVTCTSWDMSNVTPRVSRIQVLKTSNETIWTLYDYPACQKTVGRPPPVAVTLDLEILRIGSQIFSKDHKGDYQIIAGIDTRETFIDELVSRDTNVAITSRRNMTYNDLFRAENKVPDQRVDDHGEALARQMHLIEAASKLEVSTASTASKTVSGESNESDAESDTASSQTSLSDEDDLDDDYLKDLPLVLESLNSLANRSLRRSESALAKKMEEDEEFFKSDTESEGNSAEEDWSEGSSEMENDELEDEDQWNDWGNERLTFEELEADAAERSGDESKSSGDESKSAIDVLLGFFKGLEADKAERPEDDSKSGSAVGSEEPKYDDDDLENAEDELRLSDEEELDVEDSFELGSEDEKSSDDARSVESNYSQSNYSDYSNSDAEESEGEQAHQLDTLVFGKNDKMEGARKTTIQVYDLAKNNKVRRPVFHFTRFIKGGLFNSPPAFHPTKTLLIWPLGDSEILFADYKRNTYFTRFLCCSRYKSCHVFIKTHFSISGDHVHFAALEAGERDAKAGGGLFLNLQISTHRFAAEKTARTPPRLIFKTTVSLGSRESLHVSNLPYTFYWAEKEVFVTTRGPTLDVIRIPLFKDPENKNSKVCYIQSKIFLPRTTEQRTVHFCPPSSSSSPAEGSVRSEAFQSTPQTTPNPAIVFPSSKQPQSKKPKIKVDKETHATVIIGSHSSIPSQGLIVPRYQVSPPIGVFLHERHDLGGWACKPVSEEERGLRKRGEGGRLQGRFERFDQKEDCDIVPFLY